MLFPFFLSEAVVFQIGNKKENAILHLIKQARLSVNMYF